MIFMYGIICLLSGVLLINGLPIKNTNNDENLGLQPLPGAFEFDMMLTPQQYRAIQQDIAMRRMGVGSRKRKIIADGRYYWPNAVIPYEMDPSVEYALARRLIKAIKDWEKMTCLRFKPRSSVTSSTVPQSDVVIFKQVHSGCGATVGRIGGPQLVNVSASCSVGTVAHELGHVIGFVHEQSRPDRDQYVQIMYRNIEPGKTNQFDKYSSKEVLTFNLPYNVGSIMHYSSTAFSKDNRLHTIESKEDMLETWMGQREEISFLDIKLANLAYRCNAGCNTNTRSRCENGGYIGPSCTCVCPYGLTGSTCNDVNTTNECNGVLTATYGTIESTNYPRNYDNDENCYWFIKGRPGTQIQLNFVDFETENSTLCEYDYLEIRQYGADRYGQRYCGSVHQGRQIIHRDNKLLIHFKSDPGFSYRGFQIKYKILGQ